MPPRKSPDSLRPVLAVAAIALTLAIGLLAVMLMFGDRLARLGLVGQLWYVLLVLLGVAAAVSLFKLFKSYGVYKGKPLGGTIEIGGPGVLMLAIVGLGFALAPTPAKPFDQTVFVHGEAGRQSLILQGKGIVQLDLASERRREAVGAKGEVRFVRIPQDLRGTQAEVALLDADEYELVPGQAAPTLGDEPIYLAVRPKSVALYGEVTGADGQPLAGAVFSLAAGQATTDASGRFRIDLPATLAEAQRQASVVAPGHQAWRGLVQLGGGALQVQLERAP